MIYPPCRAGDSHSGAAIGPETAPSFIGGFGRRGELGTEKCLLALEPQKQLIPTSCRSDFHLHLSGMALRGPATLLGWNFEEQKSMNG